METIFKNNFEDFYSEFKKIEKEAKKIWKEVDPENYEENSSVSSIAEDGITFEWEVNCWGSYTEKYFIPVAWFDRDDKKN